MGAGQGVNRRRGRQQVGRRHHRPRAKAALGDVLRQQPFRRFGRGGMRQAPQQGQRRRRRRRQAHRDGGVVRIAAFLRAQALQAGDHAAGVRNRDAEVLVGADGEEAAVGRAVFRVRGLAIAAVRRAVRFDPLAQGAGGRLVRRAEPGPAPGEAVGMHEVQRSGIVVAGEEGAHPLGRRLALQGDQSLEPEDGVIKVARAVAILEAAVGVEPGGKEVCGQVGRVTEQRRRQSGHLQHFEPQTHCTSPESRR